MAAQLNIQAGGAAPDAALAPAPQVHPLPIAVYRIDGFGTDARAVSATSSVVKATEKIFDFKIAPNGDKVLSAWAWHQISLLCCRPDGSRPAGR